MEKSNFSRRQFVETVSVGSIAAVAASSIPAFGNISHSTNNADKLAILGGTPVVKGKVWPKWPYIDEKMIEAVVNTTRSGMWCRMGRPLGTVSTFEKEYAKLIGVNFCVGTGSGTQSLNTCVEALEIGAGDEVITSPYTDMGTIAAILTSRALPVMADLDSASFQLDPDEVEKKITANTKAIIPVHIMGVACNMKRIMAIAKKNNLKVIEDSCQAHLAEYQGKKLGTIGNLGCFSFQETKAIACGEGGAIIGNDEELMERCFTVQNHGTTRKGVSERIAPKYRMTEFEGAILLGQLPCVKDRFLLRNENAAYLNSKLKEIPGIVPQKQYEGTNSSGYYKYALSYHKENFNGISRDIFLKALAAEGIGMTRYIANGLHKEPWTTNILKLKVYQKMYSPARLKQYSEEMDYPKCDQVCADVFVLSGPGPLLGTRQDMDDIINAITKVYENRDQLKG